MHPPESDHDTAIRRLVGRLRFRHLQLLVTLQSHRSLHAAAAALNQTQSALSKALVEVEASFGFALFERSPRGLSPTAHGAIAMRGAALLLSELEHLGQEVMRDEPATVLRLGAPPFIAHGYLPAKIQAFQRRAAGVRVALMEERAPMLFEALQQGQLDALVTIYPPELLRGPGQGLALEKLFDAEFAVIAARGHPLARSRRVDWARIAREPWIMPGPNAMLRRVIEDGFRRAGLMTPQPAVESTSPVTNLQLVASGLGLGVVPQQTLQSAPAKERVCALRVSPALQPIPVALVVRSHSRNPRTELLREVLLT